MVRRNRGKLVGWSFNRSLHGLLLGMPAMVESAPSTKAHQEIYDMVLLHLAVCQGLL